MPQPTAIVRLTKVIHRGMPLFQRWLEDLSAGRVIYPFANYYCSPISATSAIEGIARIAEQRAAGVWQISSTDDVSYAEIGGHFAQGLGRDPKAWVEPTLAAAGTLEHLPRYASLDTAETRPFLGTVPRSSLAVIDEVFFGGAKP
jgi:dTDP-4-dehydrorhamnose reductase